jgi:hypothetical protein
MVRIRQASLLCYRIFDVADEIDLEHCRRLIAKEGTETRRLRLRREGSEFIQLSNAPLSIDLGARAAPLRGSVRELQVGARIFDHGAVSLQVRVPIAEGCTLDELVPWADSLYDSPELDALALEELGKLRTLLAPAMEDAHLWEQNESYAVIAVRQLEGATATEVQRDPALARLLLGEASELRLSDRETSEVLKHHFAYTDDDLAVIEWNAAFVYEPSGSDDIADLLEIANAQLLGLRSYDQILDHELSRLYDVIGRNGRRPAGGLLFSPYKRLLRELMGTLIELSEFIERIENVLKIVGDVYLARVYEGAVAQLRLREWSAQVGRKHRLLQQTYGLLKGEVDTGRALTLESMVVVLILLEIVMALVRVTGH